jgi:hypothetical protein
MAVPDTAEQRVTQNPGAQPIADERIMGRFRESLRWVIYASVAVVIVVLILDFIVLVSYGLSAFDATMNAEGNFGLPVVTGAIGIGVAIAWYHEKTGRHLFD